MSDEKKPVPSPPGFVEWWLDHDTSFLRISRMTSAQFKLARQLASDAFAAGDAYRKRKENKS